MVKSSDLDAQRKREKIQQYFWAMVGCVEHVNVPKLEDAIRKEFKTRDDRIISTQKELMQTEGRIRIQAKNKVWINQPPATF